MKGVYFVHLPYQIPVATQGGSGVGITKVALAAYAASESWVSSASRTPLGLTAVNLLGTGKVKYDQVALCVWGSKCLKEKWRTLLLQR